MFRHTYGIHQIEQVFAESIGCDIAQLFVADGSHATAFHLRVELFRANITHEHHDFKGFDVGTGGYQCNSDGNTEVFIIAELSDQLIAVTSRIRDLLDKCIVIFWSFENLFSDLDDVCCMSIIQRKNERFGQIVHIGLTLRVIEHFGINRIAIGF